MKKLIFLFAGCLFLIHFRSNAQTWNGYNTTSGRAAIGIPSPFSTDKVSIYNNNYTTGLRIITNSSFSGNSYGIYSSMTSFEGGLGTQRYAIYGYGTGANTWAFYSEGRTGIQGDLERINTTIGNQWVNHLGYATGDYSYNITPRDANGNGLFDRNLTLLRDGAMVKRIHSSTAEAFKVRKNGTDEFLILGNGAVYARSLTIKLGTFPDYVFSENYYLMPLSKLRTYIEQHHHLPNIPSEKEIVEHGLDVGDIQSKQMEKIEELTLYILELNDRMEKLEKENEELKNK